MRKIIIFLLIIANFKVFSQQENISDLSLQLKKIGEGIDYILKDYINEKIVEADYQLQKRFNDGYVLYILKDYTRASMIFYDIVSKKEYYKDPVYVECLYYLAESFKLLNNLLGAQEYYKQVLEHPSKKFYQDSLQQILEISYKIGDFRDINSYMEKIEKNSSSIRPEIFYARGKSAYYQKEYKTAIESFSKLLDKEDFKIKALYFIGVNYTALKDYDKAIETFNKIYSIEPKTDEESIIYDYSILSLGRIYYTTNKITEAIDVYQDLKRTSPFYDVSLYESAWCFIKDNNYEKALFAIDLLIDVLPNSIIIPEAILLKGNLYNEMNRADDALKTYSQIIAKYSKVSDDLNHIIEHNDKLEDYFLQLMGTNLDGFSAAKFLPKEAVKYVQSEKLVQKAQKIVVDVEQTKKYIEESNVVLNKLLSILSDKKSVNSLFPKTDEVRIRSLEYLNNIIKIEFKFAELLNKSYEKQTKDKSEKITKLKTERIRLFEIFEQVPASKGGYEKRKQNMQEKYGEIEKRSYSLGIKINEMKKQIAAMEKLFNENSEKYKYSESKKQLFYDQIEQKKKIILNLEEKLSTTSKEVTTYKNTINLLDDANLADDKLRQKISETIKKEIENYTGVSFYSQIEPLFDDIEQYKKKLLKFSDNIDKIVENKAEELKQDVLKEQTELEEYSKLLDEKILASKKLAAKIALYSFKAVNSKFHNIILSSDVGIIEVAWKNKEKISSKILDFYSEKNNRSKILENEFKEILGEIK